MTTATGPGYPLRGHRRVPHTGDLRVEAWAPTREECIAEAVRGMVGSFAELPADASHRTRECVVAAEDDGRLLVAVLEEVVYRMDVADEIPVDVTVTPEPDGVRVRFTMADSSAATQTGAVPKAVALHGLRLAQDAHGWACRVTLDV
ncbi:archease [Streptomyces shenzhenensis]|uniref:archease n=1 Tax=Streptomyces shenzhenensis TaxID=943815 RepID=UPI0015F009EE|nr:archease [Streptomyces shenzhenensis]